MILSSCTKTLHFQHKDMSRDLETPGHPLERPRAVGYSAVFLAGDLLALTASKWPLMVTCCLIAGALRLEVTRSHSCVALGRNLPLGPKTCVRAFSMAGVLCFSERHQLP